ncbi:MBL fold metallo-hydrolase [Mucilaginibacter sp. PPCGB 2223]|uniref:MBL fold metallo-hydrolase RNA specificity domain-containing protein n=1 Tax=Mucilaginibacter sp. PPCGB 2223 TaxID=1886027 RepID=UPI000826B98D|nr:MBL fold metallo-hydrolase [Mucilaginibacter sp. PPCGB 2223]OCX53911.1 MBL fold metallo-hydrolase [Mucilaginibacter sp. PPCGB 2223]
METSGIIEDKQAVYIRSLGGAETVTGSKHLLCTPELNVLIDCGLFQGIKSLREKNWETLPVDPATIGALILTHAHLDHCGYIPLLVKNGYRGKIYMSEPTRDLTEIILRDSAKLQEEDADRANRHGYSKHHPAKPLYTTADVESALYFFETVTIGKEYSLNSNISFQFYPAGHILGACSVRLSCYHKTILFSGDIGRYHSELLPAPQHPQQADIVFMESTYGDRLHDHTDSGQEMAYLINDTIFRGGNILIPCFAVGRAQDVVHILYQLKSKKNIPAPLPVFLDSPMASSASKALLKYPDWTTISEQECRQMFSGITINQDYERTKKIIKQKGDKIILAASGMLTGGRVLEYLKHYITDQKNTIIIIGYQAEGTRGRALLNQAFEIKIHGQYYPVRAKVKEIGDLSAHADQAELLKWLKDFKPAPPNVYLVHGEPGAQEALRVKIRTELGIDAVILKRDVPVLLFRVG